MSRASEAVVRSLCFLQLVLGEKVFKSGQGNNRICVFMRSKEDVGTGHKLTRLAGKGVIKGQSEWCGLWDFGRGQDNHPFFSAYLS